MESANDKELDQLLNEHFAGRVVRKDLTKLIKEGANVPSMYSNTCWGCTVPRMIQRSLNRDYVT